MSSENSYSTNELESIKQSIELMNKQDQIEVLKVLSKHLCKLNENKRRVCKYVLFIK